MTKVITSLIHHLYVFKQIRNFQLRWNQWEVLVKDLALVWDYVMSYRYILANVDYILYVTP
jgi:hypothetical protein